MPIKYSPIGDPWLQRQGQSPRSPTPYYSAGSICSQNKCLDVLKRYENLRWIDAADIMQLIPLAYMYLLSHLHSITI